MAMIHDNKLYLNLIEQVQKNKDDIARHYEIDRVLADWGIKVLGVVPTSADLPETANDYGDAYRAEDTGYFWIWTRSNPSIGEDNDYWLNIGSISLQGPEGPIGPQGPQGEQGERGNTWTVGQGEPSLEAGTKQIGDLYLDYASGNVYRADNVANGIVTWTILSNIRGPQGIQGVQGPQGIEGPQGPQGLKGDTGDVGGFINIAGIVANTDQLPLPTDLHDLTVAYLVGAAEPYNLYIQVGSTSAEALWTDMGPLNVATYVTVNGQYQNVWNADTKVNVQPDPNILYGNGSNGSQRVYAISGKAIQGSFNIAKYADGILETLTPIEDNDCANKAYVDALKICEHYINMTFLPTTDYIYIGAGAPDDGYEINIIEARFFTNIGTTPLTNLQALATAINGTDTVANIKSIPCALSITRYNPNADENSRYKYNFGTGMIQLTNNYGGTTNNPWIMIQGSAIESGTPFGIEFFKSTDSNTTIHYQINDTIRYIN